MAYITKRGNSYSVRYTYEDEHGKSCDKWESFPTKEEAVEWGILIKSPVPVEAPKKTTQERSIWEVDEMRAALDSMEDPILHLAVQGTTGHASADMLVNTYAHIQQSSRVELGKKFESGFYAKPDTPSPQAVPAAGEPTISMTALLELLKDADPEMKAKLRLALLT